jgi:hypothetical protein
MWELRWTGHQSVIIGAHPETGRYRWLPGCSPHDIPDPAEAPEWLLELLLIQEHPDASVIEPTADDAARAVVMLQFIPAADHSSYHEWLRIGMALHHTDPGLLSAWVDWCRPMGGFDEEECLAKWQSFGRGHKGRSATIATLHFLAKPHGYQEPRQDDPLDGFDVMDDGSMPGPGETLQGGSKGPPKGSKGAKGQGGAARLSAHQVLALLPERLGGEPRLDIRSGSISTPQGVLSGNDCGHLYLRLSTKREAWPKEGTADAAAYLARLNTFDPVLDYLQCLQCEALPLEQWQRLDLHLLGIDDSIAAEFLPRFLISAVARAFEPGCGVRQSPVLIGPQWRGKTALGRILFGQEHWIEGVGTLDKDALLRCHTAWGVELSELNGVSRRSDQEALKAFLTERADCFRRPYDRSPEQHLRRFVFWGTANLPPFRDSSGSTRFVSIPVQDQMLPLDWAIANRDALWRQAVLQYQTGIPWDYCTEDARAAISERNEDYAELDPWAELIRKGMGEPAERLLLPVKYADIYKLLNVPDERQSNVTSSRIRAVMGSLGWVYGVRRWGEELQRGFWPST